MKKILPKFVYFDPPPQNAQKWSEKRTLVSNPLLKWQLLHVVLMLAHVSMMAGHLEIIKTSDRISAALFWQDVLETVLHSE